jgi:hypothetical protein
MKLRRLIQSCPLRTPYQRAVWCVTAKLARQPQKATLAADGDKQVGQRPVVLAPGRGLRSMRYEIADHEWAAINQMLPNKPRGIPRVNHRRVLNGSAREIKPGAGVSKVWGSSGRDRAGTSREYPQNSKTFFVSGSRGFLSSANRLA